MFAGFILMMLNSYWEIYMITLILMFLSSLISISSNFFNLSLECFFYFNSVSSLMMFLTIFLVIVSYLSTLKNKNSNYMVSIFILMLVLIFTFMTKNLVFFYIFFEISLIPTLYLIISWGYQPERLQAGNYMMIYTVFASLPLLIIILFYSIKNFSSDIYMLSIMGFFISNPMIISLMMLAFLVKLPMYGFHLWLPKAHVEAPLAGSMLLAGILLKLGGYGLFLMMNTFKFNNIYYFYFVIGLSIWGAVLSTFMCMQQNDLKAMVAYSSVAHMGMLVSCVLLDSSWGLCSLKLIMISHGFISPGMFLMAMLTYKMSNSRSLSYSKGLLSVSPILCLFWFLFCFCNMAAPPSLNFLGEMMFIPIIMNISPFNYFVIGLLMFMSVMFSMYMYTSVNHGVFSNFIKPFFELKSNDILSIILHLITFLLVFKLNFFIY
uniref:NADH-ubiquinone oxidoreductase chain 4 n=1 Tax=Succinea erythrophana TaxID=3003847 RepID=A0A9E9IZ60_9EUPU|nr:NADH dehydrogenase subunit 4 [Succinea erythrophana]WAO26028.1 NADH dehydrogenase subunit 4 [Succinea erythrophana]